MAKKSRRTRIDDVIDEQGAELDALTERETRTFLRAYDDARRELYAALAATPADQEYSQQRLRVMLAQLEDGHRRMTERLNGALGSSERKLHDKALADLIGVVKKAEPSFTDAGNQIEVATLRRLAADQGLALHKYSVARYGVAVIDEVQRELVVGVTRGQSVRELADRLAGPNGVLAGFRGRAELIARMELSRAYNTGHQASLEELAAYDDPDDPDPLLKKADEVRDHRNHPFSRVMHGRAVLPRQEWEVPIAEVPKGGLSGVVWARTAGFVHGFNFPAHFNERGRQVPWRQSWGPCILQVKSFREGQLKREDVRSLRRVGADDQVEKVPTRSRRELEFAGYIDGRGRLLPAGQRALDERGRLGRRTWPSGTPDPSARASGAPRVRPVHPAELRSWEREVESADAFARAGYRTAHTPAPVATTRGGKPDLLVEGRTMEVYAPVKASFSSMAQTLYRKTVEKGQGGRHVINLNEHAATIDQLREALQTPVFGVHEGRQVDFLSVIDEVFALKGDRLERVLG